MAKNQNKAKPKASRYNSEMAEEAGNRNVKSVDTSTKINERMNK